MPRTLRWLRDDFREFPATMVLGSLWLAVFAAMAADQWANGGGFSAAVVVSGLHNGHRFGAMTLNDLAAGETWRTVTSTFVHFGLLHIGLNLYALYQVGSLVEEWYGTGPFLAIYVVTGGGGNVVSGLIRQQLRSNPTVLSGGGSTVVMGLVALCAVASWRVRTEIGRSLRNQMLFFLGLTAALGVGLHVAGLPAIDNWGHAGGALMGAIIGLADRRLVGLARGLFARGLGWAGLLTIVTCSAAQVSDVHDEDATRRRVAEAALRRVADDERLIVRLDEVRQVFRAVAGPHAIARGKSIRQVPRRPDPAAANGAASAAPARPDPGPEFYLTVVAASLKAIDTMEAGLSEAAGSDEFRRLRRLVAASLGDPPTVEELREFDARVAALLDRLRRDRARNLELAGGRSDRVILDVN